MLFRSTKNEVVPEISNRIPIYEGNNIIGALGIGIVNEDIMAANVFDSIWVNSIFSNQLLESTENMILNEQLVLKGMIAVSRQMKDIKVLVEKIAKTSLPVLITGETGTGKEVIANAIYEASGKQKDSFIQINCAAIPGELLESELFGYEAGAFSGALREGKKGKFELANNGAILLDEIGDMPLPLQAKLLRVIEEKKFEKVGGVKSNPFNGRILATTNQDLRRQIDRGLFRKDLYYRVNTIEIVIPPLRERKEDIKALCCQFIDGINIALGLNINGIERKAIKTLEEYDWPGNVRQLKNAIERACCLADSQILKEVHFHNNIINESLNVTNNGNPSRSYQLDDDYSLIRSKEATEKENILAVLLRTNGNKREAAKILNISRSTLYVKIRKYNL